MKRLRVYLSSTFEDLKDYREAVFAALEKGGVEVARMEAYTASDERPLDLCLRDVAQSDVYVGLFAWRYGYEPPAGHGNPDGLSITELEYRRAADAGLRKLLFFAHPDTESAWPERFRDAATGAGLGGEKLARLWQTLGTEKTGSFFRRPDELATLVLASIMRSGVRGSAYNVPPLPPRFVARPALSRALVGALVGDGKGEGDAGGHTLVQGAAGFGKTTLAIDACHAPETVGAFPDGLLWVTLGETPDVARELGNLHELFTGSRPPAAGVVAAAQALARCLGRRCLVVVDDVWRPQDLEPFLSLDGPRLLVTTRIRTLAEQAGQSGWRDIPVDEMEGAEAAALLARGLDDADGARAALQPLAERLGCWPLLLGLANARLLVELKTRRGQLDAALRSVTQLFEQRGVAGFDRRNADDRHSAVTRSIEVGLEWADARVPGLAGRAAQLAAFPEDAAVPARVLAELWSLSEFDVAEDVLGPLDEVNLLRWDRDGGSVRLHDVIRQVLAARLAAAPGGAAAVHRTLIDGWKDPLRLPHAHAWRWFAWHCIGAGDAGRLLRWLTDLDWLRAKLQATDIAALLGDFDLVADDPQAQQVRRALALAAHVLVVDPSQLAAQLLGRTPAGEQALRQRWLAQLRATRAPWLRPLRPSLAPPDPALVRILDGGENSIYALALTPDGRHLVSGGRGTLRVWDLHGGRALRWLPGQKKDAIALAVSPDGEHLLAADDATLRVWDLARGRILRVLEGHAGCIRWVAVTADGGCAVSASDDATLKVWDLATGGLRHSLQGHAGAVEAVAVAPDGRVAVSAGRDDTLKVWDLHSGALLRTLQGHAAAVFAVAITPDGRRAVSAGDDRTLRVWELDSGRLLRTLEGHRQSVWALALAADGSRALSGSIDWTLKLWDLETGSLLRTFEGNTDGVRGVVIGPDGRHAISACEDGTLRVWDLGHRREEAAFEAHAAGVTAMALTPDETRAVTAAEDGGVKVWDLASAALLQTFDAHAGAARAVAVAPDGSCAVSGGDDALLKVWDLQHRGPPRRLEGHSGGVRVVAFTPDGGLVSGADDRTLRVWDLAKGEAVRSIETFLWPGALASAPGSPWVAVAGRMGGLEIRDLAGGDAMTVDTEPFDPTAKAIFLGTGGLVALAASVEGWRWAHASNTRVLRWTGEQATRRLEGHAAAITAVALTPDVSRAVSASLDGTLIVWDLARAAPVLTLPPQGGPAHDVAITGDGRHAVSASHKTVAVWDLESGASVAAVTVDAPVRRVAIANRGRTVLAGDASGQVHVFQWENGDDPQALEHLDAGILRVQGETYLSQGDVARALDFQQRALTAARAGVDRKEECAALLALARARGGNGEFRAGVGLQQRALAIARELGDPRLECEGLWSLGCSFNALGEPAAALENLELARAGAGRLGDRSLAGRVLSAIGRELLKAGAAERAIEAHAQALALARDNGESFEEGRRLRELGAACSAAGRAREAVEHCAQALAIVRELRDRDSELLLLAALGDAHEQLAEHDRAAEYRAQGDALNGIGAQPSDSQAQRPSGERE